MYPFRSSCADCAKLAEVGQEVFPHHHTGLWTKGMPHESGAWYCWCLDRQAPKVEDWTGIEPIKPSFVAERVLPPQQQSSESG